MLEVLHRLRDELHIFKDLIEERPNVMVTCPFHAGGNEEVPSMGIYIEEGERCGLANCFACGYKGSVESIIKDLGGDVGDYLEAQEEPKRKIDLFLGREVKNEVSFKMNYTKAYPLYLAERGISKEVAEEFDIGHKKDKIVFPIISFYGEEVGYITRSITTKDYKISYGTHKRFYGEYALSKKFPETKEVFIVEGVFDTLSLHQAGLPTLGLLGIGNSYQAKELSESRFRRIILVLDGDKAGREGAKKLAEEIKGKEVIVINLKDGLDPNDMTEKQIEYLKGNYLNGRKIRTNSRRTR